MKNFFWVPDTYDQFKRFFMPWYFFCGLTLILISIIVTIWAGLFLTLGILFIIVLIIYVVSVPLGLRFYKKHYYMRENKK
ncbi:MAG: hypothetical protein DRN24_05730 [Thermoplasmata archaeon]|nr:MAG: hypothetical protein DRN24_05730 [Thermoplasmata archaeon]